jgi:hypothetical protein
MRGCASIGSFVRRCVHIELLSESMLRSKPRPLFCVEGAVYFEEDGMIKAYDFLPRGQVGVRGGSLCL